MVYSYHPIERPLAHEPFPESPPPSNRRITVIQDELSGSGQSALGRYATLFVGQRGLWPLIRYEVVVLLCSWVPGGLGFWLRSKLYPLLLGRVGRNVMFGRNVLLRHPNKIFIGDDVAIDDNCCLDAKGTDNRGITIGSGAFIGRNTILSCKNGDIEVDERANIGFNCEIFSGGRVRLGKNTLVAAYTYLVGGDHLHDRTDVPVLDQGRVAKGIEVDDNVWLGAHVVIADGAHVGRDAIIGAGAVVRGEIPPFQIAAGVPARVIRDRRQTPTD
ncbi:MAG: acyltransferase [Acidobacteriota bacterium]|nr:acyltransferase [Acidobacteriota bacterium]